MSTFLEKMQQAVGKCPVCGRLPTWANHIPLTAYCWGTADNEHPEARKVIPSPLQPYGQTGRTRWVTSKD